MKLQAVAALITITCLLVFLMHGYIRAVAIRYAFLFQASFAVRPNFFLFSSLVCSFDHIEIMQRLLINFGEKLVKY